MADACEEGALGAVCFLRLTLGLREAAKAEWDRATPAVKLALERYSEGVNDGMKQLVGRFAPLEFQVLRATPPPWEPIDSLAVGRLLIWRLAENHQAELVRAAVAAKFGEAETRMLTGVCAGALDRRSRKRR